MEAFPPLATDVSGALDVAGATDVVGFYAQEGPPNIRVTVFDPTGTTVLAQDASAYVGRDKTKYDDGPDGCAAATLTLILRYEDVYKQGYWRELNVVEISSGDNTLMQSIGAVSAGGTAKLYLDTNWGFDPTVWIDDQIAFLDDGVHLTMRCPVQSVGSDTGGQYIVIGTPLGGGGIPAYTALQTTVGRRRYTGRIVRRDRINQRTPAATITCVGLSSALQQQVGSFTISDSAAQDIGTVLYDTLALFASAWPFLEIDPGNFPALGQAYSGTYRDTTVFSFVSNVIKAINTNDGWHLRIGHDRKPRLIKLYDAGSDSYTVNVTIHQSGIAPQAAAVTVTDCDASQLANRQKVTGDADPFTKIPVSAIVEDPASISLYGLTIDGQPVQQQGLKTSQDCARYAQSLLDQNSIAKSVQKCTIYTRRNNLSGVALPGGMLSGDVIPPVANVTVTDFTATEDGTIPPDITGLVSVVTSTIDGATTDMWQDAQFAAMLPPWSAEISERANAVATALVSNTRTRTGVDQYFVDPSAFDFTIVGLTVNVPAFEAVFAAGTLPVACGGNSFTLAASSLSWVWLNPGNTWTIRNDSTAVAGAIPYAFFQTNATGVVGNDPMASYGPLKLPMPYLAGNTTLVPAIGGVGPYITAGATGLVSTVLDIDFDITNQPTDGSLSKIVVYYQQIGSTKLGALGADVPRDASGNQLVGGATSATGKYAFHFPDAANGASYEFLVAMESGASKESARTSLGTITVPNGQVGPPASGNTLYRKRFNYGTSSNGSLQPGTDDSFSPISAYAGSMQLSSLFPVTLPGVTHPGISLQAEYLVKVLPGAGAQALSGSVITDADHIDIGLDGTIVQSLSTSAFAQSWSATIPDDGATHTLVLHVDKGGTAGSTITLGSEWTAFFPTTSDGRIDATKFAIISPT